MEWTVKQQYMLSVLHTQYHVCWCSGDFRSQSISSHGIDPQSQNILSPACGPLKRPICDDNGWLEVHLISTRKNRYANHILNHNSKYESSFQLYLLIHCGLVMIHGNTCLGQHWLRWWLGAQWHQATNVDFSLVKFYGILYIDSDQTISNSD